MAQGKKYIVTETDRELVIKMSTVGITHEQIAAVIGISADTLTKYYKRELETSLTKGIAKIAGTLFNKAAKGDNACMFFFLKTKGGWRETNIHEFGDKDGNSIVPSITINVKKPDAG